MNGETTKLLAGKTICVVGLGLMGGSLCLALRGKVARIHGVDPDPSARHSARRRNVVERVAESISDGVAGAHIVVLAAPVRQNLLLIEKLAHLVSSGTMIIDLSSTKRDILRAMNALPTEVLAIGGHPMCGRESSGLEHADPLMFEGQNFVLCPCERTSGDTMGMALAIVDAIGAHPIRMAPIAHDAAVARVSHLPYLLAVATVSSALVLTDQAQRLASSGFRDTTRVASSDVGMMVDILCTNRDEVTKAIDDATALLLHLRKLIDAGDHRMLAALLKPACRHRRSMQTQGWLSDPHSQQSGVPTPIETVISSPFRRRLS